MPSSVPIFRPPHEVTIQRCALAHPHRPSTLLPSPVFRHNFSLFRRRRARVSTFSSDYSRPPVRSYENTPNHGAAASMDVNSPPCLRPDPECVSSTWPIASPWSKQLDSIEMRPRDVFFPCHLFHRISIVQGISRVNACQKGVSRRMDFLLSSFIYPSAKIIRSEIDLRLFHPPRNRFDRRAYRQR